MLLTTRGRATRQYKEGGFPSKMNCSKAVTRSAETMTNPCKNNKEKAYEQQKIYEQMWSNPPCHSCQSD